MKNFLFFSLILVCALNFKAQTITTVAGGGFSGLGDGGPATSAQLSNCHGMEFDAAGNLYIADGNNSLVRKVAAGTGIITTIAGTGTMTYNGDGIAASSAALDSPWDIAVDGSGNIYIADSYNNRIRKINAGTGIISTIAGVTTTTGSGPSGNAGYNGDGIPANTAMLYHPNGVCVDAAGNVYIAEFYNNRVRKVTASTGLISTIAGTGSNSYNGDGIPANTAAVFGPNGIAIDAAGNVYISENQNQRVRKITASTGLISTIAGNGSYGFSGDGGLATQAQVVPTAILLDGAGNIYIACNGRRVRKIDASSGIINTVAGDGNVGFTGDGGPPLLAQFNNINGLAFNAAGDLFIGDAINNRVRKISYGVLTGMPFNYSSLHQSELYPNPFTTAAVLKVPTELLNPSARVIDLQGREMRRMDVENNTLIIEKADLAPGIYFVELSSKEGVFSRNKFVIQ